MQDGQEYLPLSGGIIGGTGAVSMPFRSNRKNMSTGDSPLSDVFRNRGYLPCHRRAAADVVGAEPTIGRTGRPAARGRSAGTTVSIPSSLPAWQLQFGLQLVEPGEVGVEATHPEARRGATEAARGGGVQGDGRRIGGGSGGELVAPGAGLCAVLLQQGQQLGRGQPLAEIEL